MLSNEETKLEQQLSEPGDSGAGSDASATAPAETKVSKKKASKKKASKKKASKKKASKKKASKKKASKKKASKKKASKKRRSKKKRGRKKSQASGDHMSRVLAAAEDLRDALHALAADEWRHRRETVDEFREMARSKIADLESAAQDSLARLTGKS